MRIQHLVILLLGLSPACASKSRSEPVTQPPAAPTNHDDAALAQQLDLAASELSAGDITRAVPRLEQILAHYESQHIDPKIKNYCARSQPEAILYMLLAATDAKGKDAVALPPLWSQAFYMRAYAAIEQKDLDAGERWLKRAIELSPKNSMYLAELGHLEQTRRNWTAARANFEAAVEAAELSPPDLQLKERTRAMRGVGFVMIETGELAAAKKLYEDCLALDPTDATARQELDYIEQLLAKQPPPPGG